MPNVTVIGAGLAGSEAAWQAAELGCSVELWEMRPQRETPAHRTEHFAELVCSNSLGNLALETASGLLKEELRRLGSVILRCADANPVPAGGALGVTREGFPRAVTETVHAHPNIEVIRKEVTDIPNGPTVGATGPLTSDALAKKIEDLSGETLYFYDAASPIIHRDSLDDSIIYRASRYGKGEAAYLNCPMTEEQYYAFVEDLDDAEGLLYNIVGFQTRLKWGEQRRVFRTIPGLQYADFARMGVMHRNTYLPSNHMLDATMRIKKALGEAPLFFAGQLTGVEGYVESTAMGHIAGTNAARLARGEEPITMPRGTMMGALAHYITAKEGTLQPINSNWGLVPTVPKRENGRRLSKPERRQRQAWMALSRLDEFMREGIKTAV